MYKFQRTQKCNEFSQAYYWPPWVLGIWGEWLFIFRELGSTGNHFQGFGKQAHSFEDLGSPAKSTKFNLNNLTLKKKPSFRLIFLKYLRLLGRCPQTPLGKSQCIYFRVNMLIGLG